MKHEHNNQSTPKAAPVFLAAMLIGLCVIGVHFGATAFYVMPLNPMKVSVMGPLRAYVEPYFGQGWELFAPDPLVKAPFLGVACRLEHPDGSVEESSERDVSTDLYWLHHRYRLGPAFRLRRAQVAALTLTNPKTDLLNASIEKLSNSTDPDVRAAATAVTRQKERNQERGLQVFGRVASIECKRMFPGARILAVRPAITRIEAPPFSRRLDRSAERGHDRIQFNWMPYAQGVSTYGGRS